MAIGYFVSLKPLSLAYQARSWTPAPCEVISSRVEEGDETSRPDIHYRYQVAGREYTSRRYNFLPGMNSDSTVPAVVARYPAGTSFECYVDPADPAEAVINRTPTRWYYLGLIFLAGFSGLPLAVLAFLFVQSRGQRKAVTAGVEAAGRFAAREASPNESGPAVLEPENSPAGKLITAVLVCLVWNGIVGVFTYFEYRAFVDGEGFGWLLAAFLLLFQIVGVALLVAVPYQMLALANPRPVVTLSRHPVPLGESVWVGWHLTGSAHRVTHLTLTLRGREEARYRRGTDTHTDTSVFFSRTIADVTHPMSIPRGSGTLELPPDTMHTFTADNNKIIWTLHVKGTIARWPDVDDSFEITVRPS